jgi:DNA-binding NarL/FixJ family response regulator
MPDRLPGVVIVDDHAGFRRAARVLFEDRGFMVLGEAPGPDEAHFLVALRRPDLVIVDVHLGEASGLDVAWALTAEHPGLRVLLVSSDDDACDSARAAKCGACGFLPKTRLTSSDLAALVTAG